MNKSIGHKQLISQSLSILPTESFSCPLLNYGYDKLSVDALMKIFVAAQLDNWQSYEEMEEKLRANPEFCQSINLPSISGAQLSRRINDLPTEHAQALFQSVVHKIQELTKNHKGINPELGRLKIIDSTHIKLPPELCDWAFVTKGWNVVKMHTRIVVVSEDIHYPDKIVPSTGNVADVETPHLLVEEDDATYLMDRGYPSKKNLNAWQNQDILFVVRIRNTMKVEPIETYEITHPDVIRDAKVTYTRAEQPIRLVEFLDEENRLYRLMTTRWDLSAEQIMELYRCRWMIETFFKWVKQHLKLVKIWSTKPQGMWNQMFIAMAAYGLALILQLQLKSPRNLWRFLRLMRIYLYKTYDEFMKELHHKKSRTSRGRQKVPIPSKGR
ncbi:IS4 family transposase [Paracerasibacillus soli]|uniref:IS4 family transposase n=1 Tax=Paracerasibacillus soli TaxID=480284 RepID=A0ABU5CTU3_9BACI|nr:IS4 family transposase [Virgibacillus soli]MDY0409272.1 IS4 family transposase [Virgibacillus soli]